MNKKTFVIFVERKAGVLYKYYTKAESIAEAMDNVFKVDGVSESDISGVQEDKFADIC